MIHFRRTFFSWIPKIAFSLYYNFTVLILQSNSIITNSLVPAKTFVTAVIRYNHDNLCIKWSEFLSCFVRYRHEFVITVIVITELTVDNNFRQQFKGFPTYFFADLKILKNAKIPDLLLSLDNNGLLSHQLWSNFFRSSFIFKRCWRLIPWQRVTWHREKRCFFVQQKATEESQESEFK